MEAITNLKEPTGSNKTAIAMYIEVYCQPLAEFFFIYFTWKKVTVKVLYLFNCNSLDEWQQSI